MTISINDSQVSTDDWRDRAMGLVAGLALGDAYERQRGLIPRYGRLQTGRATELALCSLVGLGQLFEENPEPMIDQVVRNQWDALRAWGDLRGVRRKHADPQWPVGQSGLFPRRRSRATDGPEVEVLSKAKPGRVGSGVESHDTGVLGRMLTLGLVRGFCSPPPTFALVPDNLVQQSVALTHDLSDKRSTWDDGHEAVQIAALAALVSTAGVEGSDTISATGMIEMINLWGMVRDTASPFIESEGIHEHLEGFLENDLVHVAVLALSITIALPQQFERALAHASTVSTIPGVAMMTGALLGAQVGLDALPENLVKRLDCDLDAAAQAVGQVIASQT